MQLYARQENQIISASQAHKQQDYTCLECQGIVRIRSGLHRQRHFYHLQLTPDCRQSQKSLEHLQTQIRLQKILGPAACTLECPFPRIQRIADVAWHDQKIILEVQCSPISASEVTERINDYQSLGFDVVWILHERTFGQRRLTAAELRLRTRPCYFCTIDAEGQGEIYDRFDQIQNGVRMHRLETLLVDLTKPQRAETLPKALKCIEKRLTETRLYFTGDLVDLALTDGESRMIAQACKIERSFVSENSVAIRCWQLLAHGYRILFRFFLEKVSQ